MGSRKQEAGRSGDREGFRRLIAWQRADDLAVAVYKTLRAAEELDPWLRSQANRAAFSVPANIAEGYARGSLGDYLHFLDFAKASLAELDYALHFMTRVELLPPQTLDGLNKLLVEAGKVLQGLWRSLKQRSAASWDHTLVREEGPMYEVGDLEADEL